MAAQLEGRGIVDRHRRPLLQTLQRRHLHAEPNQRRVGLERRHIGGVFRRDRARAAAETGADVEHAHGGIERKRLHQAEHVLLAAGDVEARAPEPLGKRGGVERWLVRSRLRRDARSVSTHLGSNLLRPSQPSHQLGKGSEMGRLAPALKRFSCRHCSTPGCLVHPSRPTRSVVTRSASQLRLDQNWVTRALSVAPAPSNLMRSDR